MRTLKKSYKILSLVLTFCILMAFVPMASSAAVTYMANYNGTDAISISSNATCEIKDGFAGKLAEDKVYCYIGSEKAGTGSGYFSLPSSRTNSENPLDSAVVEFSFLLENDESMFYFSPAFINSTGYEYFLANGKFSASNSDLYDSVNGFIRFSSEGIYLTDTTGSYLSSSYRNKYIYENLETGVWHTVAIKNPGLVNSVGDVSYDDAGNVVTDENGNIVYKGERTVYVCIDGKECKIGLNKQVYGTRHIRLHGKNTTYVDNITTYFVNQLESASDYKNHSLMPTLTSQNDSVSIEANAITPGGDITASQLKSIFSGSDEIRVYTDNTYKTLVADNELVTMGNTVVAAAKNGTDSERSYSYYTVSEPTYEEPDLYEGSTDLTISGGATDDVDPIITKADGVFGKATDDKVYKIDVLGRCHEGYNFLSGIGGTLETSTLEFSLATEVDTEFVLNTGLYTKEDKSARIDGNLITVNGGQIKTGSSSNLLASDETGKVLGEVKPGQWINLAIVVPGYTTAGETSDTVYIYVNGEVTPVKLASDIYGTRHMRFAPNGTFEQRRTFYYDNVRKYLDSTEVYSAAKDKQPVVDFMDTDLLDGNINVAKGTTVAEFKVGLDTDAAVRVFTSDDCKTLLSDSDEMSAGNTVVFAASNKRTTERTYSYYTVNRPLVVQNIKLTNASGKIIRGTLSDIEKMGEPYYLNTVITNKATVATASVTAIIAAYDASGKMTCYDAEQITVNPGTTYITLTSNEVKFENITTPEGGTLKAFLWESSNNEPMCSEFEATFDGAEEYNVLAFGNSYSQDAFSLLPSIGKAAGVDIYAVNMYTGGCPLATHYEYMNGNGAYQKRVEYRPDGENITTEVVSFDEGLNTPGYSWDYISIQSRSVEAYDYDYFEPYVKELADYIRENSPSSEVLMHQTWILDTETAKTKSHTKDLVADLSDEEIRPYLFSLLKQNYIDAAEQIGNLNRIVPVGEAVNYAVGTLGFAERIVDEEGTYNQYGRSMYRDATCHLSIPYGRVLAGLTWYEYITGHDARENPYQNSSITAADMALLKEAAHWACSQTEYKKAE